MNKIIPFLFLWACHTALTQELTTSAETRSKPPQNIILGKWKTIDDNDQKERAIIEVYEKDGKVFGKIIKAFPRPGDKPTCDLCPGDLKGSAFIGLEILKGVNREGTSKTWSGGTILDPNNGKDYKVYLELQDDGDQKDFKLKVRGFIGISLLGRTQYWYRVYDE